MMTNAPIETIVTWIPVTDELPNKSTAPRMSGHSTRVLVTVETPEGGRFVGIDRYDHPSQSWEYMDDMVTAWAPLPEPFNGFQ